LNAGLRPGVSVFVLRGRLKTNADKSPHENTKSGCA
jgi:hypothetical protein